MEIFNTNNTHDYTGRFAVPLPCKTSIKPIGESRTQAVWRLYSLERSLHKTGEFDKVNKVMQEYVDLNHSEPVPYWDKNMPM